MYRDCLRIWSVFTRLFRDHLVKPLYTGAEAVESSFGLCGNPFCQVQQGYRYRSLSCCMGSRGTQLQLTATHIQPVTKVLKPLHPEASAHTLEQECA